MKNLLGLVLCAIIATTFASCSKKITTKEAEPFSGTVFIRTKSIDKDGSVTTNNKVEFVDIKQ